MNKFYYELNGSNIKGIVRAWTKNGAIAKIYRKYGDVSGRICRNEGTFELFIGALYVMSLPAMLVILGNILRGIM